MMFMVVIHGPMMFMNGKNMAVHVRMVKNGKNTCARQTSRNKISYYILYYMLFLYALRTENKFEFEFEFVIDQLLRGHFILCPILRKT